MSNHPDVLGHIHVTPASSRRPAGTGEPALMLALAVCVLATGWSAGVAPATGAAALLLVVLGAMSRSDPLATATRVARGGAVVLIGTGCAVLDPALAPLALVCSLATAAAYPLWVSPRAGRWLAAVAVAGVAVPFVARPLLSLDGAALGGPAGPVAAVTLGGAAVVVAAGALAGIAGRSVEAAHHAAARSAQHARQAGDELSRRAHQDALTGLPNREALLVQAVRALSRQDAVGGGVGLLVLEVERFSALADSIGTQGADEALAHVARRLRASRPGHDAVARTARAQFAVLIEGVGPEGCSGIARRMTAMLEEPVVAAGREVSITFSIGVVLSAAGVDTAAELLRAGEQAAGAAQAGGRSRWATFDQALRAHTQSQATLELELRDVLRRGDLEVVFQPFLRLGHEGAPDRLDGVEALARWTRSDGSAVPPSRFVALAEELGLGPMLGFQVLDRSLDAFAAWRGAGLPLDHVGVNVSRSQLADPDFAHTVSARLAARELPASALAVDVRAEDLSDDDQAATTLAMLHSLGVSVRLDDFGRRGSSLAGLAHAPLSMVKLDRSVVATLGRGDAVARHLVSLCGELGLPVSAEGVETTAQLDALRRLRVDAVQGFLVGHPLREEDLAHVLAARTPVPATGPGRRTGTGDLQ